MRIFLQSFDLDREPTDKFVLEAVTVLKKANIVSARPGGFVNELPVVMVDSTDVPYAIASLRRAGIHGLADSR
jgi:hypothetical protein